MSKSMMDLNLGPDLDEAQELQHEAEMNMIKAHNEFVKCSKIFARYVEKLAQMKADIPENAFKIEKEDYGNVRDKQKVSQPAPHGSGGAQKPQLHTPKIDQRQVGVVAGGSKEKKRSNLL